ncbi:MAG: prepilin-type N-terminal cleavage/methylation domain-containing protein [Candidatus Omnitrophica bacterium]|nr:prepilin-type N-terminal cleavage/methylation domain-containing protein [Candidatus Omnitrophota bacterium]
MHREKALTLIELLIAIILLSVISLGFTSISMFTNFQTITSDRRAKLQNTASLILEHMSKNIANAIGNETTDGVNMVVNTAPIGADEAVRVFVDVPSTAAGAAANTPNGIRDASDHWIAYRRDGSLLQFCPACTDSSCTTCNPGWGTPINNLSTSMSNSNGFVSFAVTKPTKAGGFLSDNYIEVAIFCRWNPANAVAVDNPEINMRNRIKMPSVSVN